MGDASKYWRLVRIDAAGSRKVQEIPSAKAFFTQVFNLLSTDNISDGDIQHKLLQLNQYNIGEESLLAERCLLCFLSWIIEQGCVELERKFGENHNFGSIDLLPYVLDDDGKILPSASYQCFSRQILQSFDSQKSSLSTWAMMKVKQHPSLNQFLLECGVYLISDWAILNDTQPKQLERILKEFHTFTDSAIQQYQCLLQSYHAVYRV